MFVKKIIILNVKCSIYTIKKCVRTITSTSLIPAESTLNTYCLINNHWIKVSFYLCTLTMKTRPILYII